MLNRNKTDQVVVLLVHDGDDHIIIVRDRASQTPDKWEFPGGRMYEGETREDAAVRILLREVNVCMPASTVGRPVAEVQRGGRTVTSVRINLPPGPAGELQRFTPDGRHELQLISRRQLRDFMPRKQDRVLATNGYRASHP